jgi:hypothetical protein
VEDCYKFIVVPGNNSGLVRKAIERREWWIEIPPVHSMYNFKWQPVSYGIKFDRLGPVRSKPGGEWGSSGNQASNNGGSGNAPGRGHARGAPDEAHAPAGGLTAQWGFKLNGPAACFSK